MASAGLLALVDILIEGVQNFNYNFTFFLYKTDENVEDPFGEGKPIVEQGVTVAEQLNIFVEKM